MLYVLVKRITSAHHRHVDQSVWLVRSVPRIKRVSIKNASTHAQVPVGKMLDVKQLTIIQYVVVHLVILETRLCDVYLNVRIFFFHYQSITFFFHYLLSNYVYIQYDVMLYSELSSYSITLYILLACYLHKILLYTVFSNFLHAIFHFL